MAELKLDLNFGGAEARIDAIIQRLERATQAAVQFQQAINSGGAATPTGTNGSGYNPGLNGSGAASTAAGLNGSAAVGVTGGSTPAQQHAQANVAASAANGAAAASTPMAGTAQIGSGASAPAMNAAALAAVMKAGAPPGLAPYAYNAFAQQLGMAVPYPAVGMTPGGAPLAASIGMGAATAATAAGLPPNAATYPGPFGPFPAAAGAVISPGVPFGPSPVPQGQITPQQAAMLAAFGRPQPSGGANAASTSGSIYGYGMMAGAVVSAGTTWLDYRTNVALSGGGPHSQPYQEAGVVAEVGAGLLVGGTTLAITRNPLLAVAAGGIAAAAAGALGRNYAQPLENERLAAYPVGLFRAAYPKGSVPSQLDDAAMQRLIRMQRLANMHLGPLYQYDENSVSPELGKGEAALYSGMVAGGISPFSTAPGKVTMTGEVVLSRLARMFGNPNVAAGAERVAPVFATLPETGGNIADMLMRYGPEVTADFLRTQSTARDLSPAVSASELSYRSASVRGAMRSAGITAQAGRGYGAEYEAGILRGLRATGAGPMVAHRQDLIRQQIGSIDTAMSHLASLPNGRDSAEYQRLAADRAELTLNSQQIGSDYTGLVLSQSAGEYAVRMGKIGVASTYAGLYDATGAEVARVGTKQGMAIDSRVRELQRLRDTARKEGRLDYGTDLAIGAEITGLQQQRVTIPAQAASRGLQLTEMAFGVSGAQAGAAVTAAGLYGGNSDLSKAFDNLAKQLASRIEGVTEQLKNQNLPIDQRRAAETEVANLQGQQAQVRAQAATALVGRSALVYGSTAAAAQTGVVRATLYGTDGQVSGAFGATAGTLAARASELDAQIANPNVPFETRQRLIAEREGVKQQQLQVQAASTAAAIGRIEARSSTLQGQTSNVLHAAAVVGGAADVGQAASGHIAALHNEAAQLGAKLNAGGLSFDQEQGVRQRLNTIQRESFDTVQGAIDTGMHKADLSGYGLLAMRQSNAEQRIREMPYAPGNVMAAQMQGIGLRSARVRQLRQRESMLAAAGLLSPERRFDMESEIEGSITANYQTYAEMTTGAENRLGALSSRMPAGFRTFNGSARAAVFNLQGGVPFLGSGFMGGAHERAVESLFGNALPYPRSPMANLNPAGAFGGGDVAGLLTQILQELRQQNGRGKGSFPRMNRGPGDLPPSGGYQRTGANTPFN